jgi:hypothetical protein
MANFAGRNTLLVAAMIYFLTVPGISIGQAEYDSGCSKIQTISDQIQKIKAQRDSIAVGDKAQWCPLNKQQIDYSDEMIRAFESDRRHCGVRDSLLERLKTTNERLRQTTSEACGL